MCKFIGIVWNMCKMIVAYLFGLASLVCYIPGYTLMKLGRILECCGDSCADSIHENTNIVDMR